MISIRRFICIISVAMMGLIFFGSASADTPMVDVTIGTAGIQITPVASGVTFIMLRVVNPQGEMVCDRTSGGEAFTWAIPAGAADGIYRYEVKAAKTTKKGVRNDEAPPATTTRTRPWVKNGSFLIQDGALAPAVKEEAGLLHRISQAAQTVWTAALDFWVPSASADVLHYDDVITTGSLCVGFDCADGESFGYNTIKIKENNLEIGFEDSSTGTFPTNDWKIQVNDTTSGGASYFTIWDVDGGRRPFTIEAGAPAHALYVEDYGRIGLGTSIPYVELHIVDGDSPTVRLDQDGSSGWAAQRWDICGNETNFFVRDVTNGSKLCFRIQPATPSNTICTRSSGYVGIGTWSPEAKLEVETTGEDSTIQVQRTDGATAAFSATDSGVTIGSISEHPISIVTNDTEVMNISTTGNVVLAGNLELGSSREIKDHIQSVEATEALQTLEALRPVKFTYKANPADEVLGFIAEDVPDLVATQSRRTTSPMDVVAVLTRVVQEQQKTIADLEQHARLVDQQQKTIALLVEKIAELENGMRPGH